MNLFLKIVKNIAPTFQFLIPKNARQAVDDTLNDVYTVAQQRVVVWTGALRGDIRIVRESPLRGAVTNTLPYAPYIHSDRPYIADASHAVEPRWEARLQALYGEKVTIPPLPTLSRYPSKMAAKYGHYLKGV